MEERTMAVRVQALVILGLGFALTACNDSKLVNGASCPSNPTSTAVSAPQQSFAADNTPASATALAQAMDVDGVTSPTLSANPVQAAAFNGLGSLHAAGG